MFYPYNLLVGILFALAYIFIFWKFKYLGKYRIPFFVYAIVVQLAFLISYTLTFNYFKSSGANAKGYYDDFAIGIMIFYFLFIIPLVILLCIQTYKGIIKMTITRTSRFIMMILFILLCLVICIIGFYLHVFWYYGFAP